MNIQSFSVWIYLFGLVACSNHTANNSGNNSPLDTSSTTKYDTNIPSIDSSGRSKDDLTKIYSQSIANYIQAVNSEYKIDFDTLYFGKHVYGQPDDFPDIDLPETIENTQIRLMTPEFGSQKQKQHKSSFFINLIGWVNHEKAEFIFVTFSNGSEHQFDCLINYKYDVELKEFGLETLRFENYRFKKKD